MQVDAHVALLSVNSFAFVSFPFGIATAATIRVGNLLGARRPQLATTSAWCAVACGAVSMLVCAAATILLRHKIGLLFIDDRDCLLYTSPSPRDRQKSRMPSSA